LGVLIGLTGFLIIILSVAKENYNSGSRWLADILGAIVSYSILKRIWPWLPNKLLSLETIIGGMCPVVISLIFTSYAFYMYSIIREAERSDMVARAQDRRRGPRYRQSVERVNAGRDVTITQIANANHKLEEWTHSFWKGPLGALLLTVVAIVIAAVFTKFTGLTP
jgi:hypothetical protein